MKKLLTAALVLCTLAVDVEAREIAFQDVLRNHHEEITSITACGRWISEAEGGFYRVIMADFLLGGSRFWVQWMKNRDRNGRTQVLYTQAIKEFNDEHAEFLIGDAECSSEDPVGLTCTFAAADGHTGEIFEFEVKFLKEFGQYRILKNRDDDGGFEDSGEISVRCSDE